MQFYKSKKINFSILIILASLLSTYIYADDGEIKFKTEFFKDEWGYDLRDKINFIIISPQPHFNSKSDGVVTFYTPTKMHVGYRHVNSFKIKVSLDINEYEYLKKSESITVGLSGYTENYLRFDVPSFIRQKARYDKAEKAKDEEAKRLESEKPINKLKSLFDW